MAVSDSCLYFLFYDVSSSEEIETGKRPLPVIAEKGDHVVTSGGVHGTIKVLRDKYVELEIAPKVVIKVEKTAIQHGDVELIDKKEAEAKGAAALGNAAMDPDYDKKKEPDEVVEEVIEVDDPKDAGTEVVEEVVEVDEEPASKVEKKNSAKEEKK